jgi:hypothetical protein
MDNKETVQEKMEKMIKNLKNDVYLYCEENSLPEGSVKFKQDEETLSMIISPSVEEEHRKILEGMMEDFERNLLKLSEE